MAYIPKDAKWYLADVVMQLRIDGEPRSVVQVNTLLVRADSPGQAYDEAMTLGRDGEVSFENTDGHTVRITFRGLADLNVIHGELAHGAEIAYAEHVGLSEEDVGRKVRERADLAVFRDRRPSRGPNYMPKDIQAQLRQAGYDQPSSRSPNAQRATAKGAREQDMPQIHYLKGDATAPTTAGNKIICHVCNDIGGWGKGFVLAISKRWRQPEAAFRAWHRDRDANDFALGAVQLVQVQPDTWVANMVGQHGLKRAGGKPPIRYEAVEAALERLATEAQRLKATVHMPRIGCGLAGGTWDRIEPIIRRTLCDRGVGVYVYDFE